MSRRIVAKPGLTDGASMPDDAAPKLRIVAQTDSASAVFATITGDDPLRELARHGEASIDLLYGGGVVHRVPRAQADGLLAECLRVLKPFGSLRLTTIDLDAILHGYLFDWDDDGTAGLSRTQRLNAAISQPGAVFLYGEEELIALLTRAGFAEIVRFGIGASSNPRFWNLESDLTQGLVLEARKP